MIENSKSNYDEFIKFMGEKEFDIIAEELTKAVKNHEHNDHICDSMKSELPGWKLQRTKFPNADFAKFINDGMRPGEWGPWLWISKTVPGEVGRYKQLFCVCCLEDLPQ